MVSVLDLTQGLQQGVSHATEIFGRTNILAIVSHQAPQGLPMAEVLQRLHSESRSDLEQRAEQLRVAILGCRPKALLGYLWAQLLLGRMGESQDDQKMADGTSGVEPHGAGDRSYIDDLMFALEYVHAVLSSHPATEHGQSTVENNLRRVLTQAAELRHQSLMHCMLAASQVPKDLFDDDASETAMQAMSTWVTLRGHRYQSLEAEFFAFVLSPHEEALRQAYGVGAEEVARGIQAAVDATRFGHMRAADRIETMMNATYALAEKEGIEVADAVRRMEDSQPTQIQTAQDAISDMFFGGICDVMRSSELPAPLLDDLTFIPGEEKEFFADGALRGTPLRRMPGRVKPFVLLDGQHYTCDANFMRDSAYRSLQWGLLTRLPDYKHTWAQRQAIMAEGAFLRIFQQQLRDAESWTSFYYPDPVTGAWVENDLLILMQDVLVQIEVKAGVMPMHSPELYLDRHVRTVQELVIKAYEQCERFLRYATSADEVPIYQLLDGKHKEIKRIRLADYRAVIPIGLTVESFTPFSSMSKRLEKVRPIQGRYPFVSMSVDDLFVLTRFLPSTGELLHYLAVRQRVAGQKKVFIFDEIDHLGAYIQKNRMDMYYEEQLAEGASMLIHIDACVPVDAYFDDPDWQGKSPPSQPYAPVLLRLLAALDRDRGHGFLQVDAWIRDLSEEGRLDMVRYIEKLMSTLDEHPDRWFMLLVDEPVMIWLQRAPHRAASGLQIAKAEAMALASDAPSCKLLQIQADANGQFFWAAMESISAPLPDASNYEALAADALRMRGRAVPITATGECL